MPCVHEGGFRIERDYRNRWIFKRPDGRAVPSCSYQAKDMIDDDIDGDITELSTLINYPSAEGFEMSAFTTSSRLVSQKSATVKGGSRPQAVVEAINEAHCSAAIGTATQSLVCQHKLKVVERDFCSPERAMTG